MTRKLILRPGAETDLAEIWLHTAQQWSPAQADKYILGLNDLLKLLVEQPEIAPKRGRFTPPTRIHPYRSHLVIFTADDTTVDVIRVVHGRSNWKEVIA